MGKIHRPGLFLRRDVVLLKDMEWKETAAVFALSNIYSLEPRFPKAIVENLGNARAVFEMDRDSLDSVLGPFNRHSDAIRSKTLEQWADELEKSMPVGWIYITYHDDAFPENLQACEDSPLGFYFSGRSSPGEVFSRQCISIVGTRDMSSYGSLWCRKLTAALAETEQRPTIVSGLAFGVDITAQISAMENGLPTIAVMATGAGTVYPRQHEFYAAKIAESPFCALLTEYPPGNRVCAMNFLSRNRIIAGLSSATVLVESRLKGGGITTAKIAASYSRDVFAVPGRCDDLRSQGCNMLIHRHVAESVIDCDSFVRDLNFKKSGVMRRGGKLTDRMAELVLAIRKNRDIGAPELAALTGRPLGDILSETVILENDGIIQCDILGRYSIKKD